MAPPFSFEWQPVNIDKVTNTSLFVDLPTDFKLKAPPLPVIDSQPEAWTVVKLRSEDETVMSYKIPKAPASP